MVQTRLSIRGEDFAINGEPTLSGRSFRGHRIEGLLPNARMVQATFDDLNPETRDSWKLPDGTPYDAERNLAAFLHNLPVYRDAGLLAVTINFQGGSPFGYSERQPWHNSAFEANGVLRQDYAGRVGRVLDAADGLGMAVILGIFYFGQVHRFEDDKAVLRAVDAVTDMLVAREDGHVIVEIANEQDHPLYAKSPVGVFSSAELIRRVQERSAGKLSVSTSYLGGAMPEPDVADVADVILIHGNGVHVPAKLVDLIDRVRAMPSYRGQPIVVNEDDHFDFEQPENNFLAATSRHASWGYFDFRKPGEPWEAGYQSVPSDWRADSHPRKSGFFRLLREMTR